MPSGLYFLVENLLAYYFIVGGTAFLVNPSLPSDFFNAVTHIENKVIVYLIAWMFLIFGFFTILTHNDWSWGYSIIVTLFGWIFVVRGSLWLLFPKQVSMLVKKMTFIKSHQFRITYGILFILIGLFILASYFDPGASHNKIIPELW